MSDSTVESSPENNPQETNNGDSNRRNKQFLNEYTESRIRPANRNSNDDHPPLDISKLPSDQREALIEEVTDSLRKILAPVSICLTCVVVIISSITFYSRNDGVYLPYVAFYEDGPISGASKLGHAIANSLIIIGVVVAMTFFLVLLYYCKCYKIIHGWLIFVSFMVLFLFSGNFLTQVIEAANWSFDYISYAVILFNFGILGLVAIHWKSPLKIQQFYLISTSALMSLVFIKYLPEWTSWVFLVALATYDIIAVLCPAGPLKMLINIVQERNQPLMPALIYSSMAWVMSAVRESSEGTRSTSNTKNTSNSSDNSSSQGSPPLSSVNQTFSPETRSNASVEPDGQVPEIVEDGSHHSAVAGLDDYEVAGVKLGLGDFIFYSVLIGKAAASNDWNTVYACTVGILTGLCSTLILLAVSKHALPALPISIALGVLFYFTTYYSVTPMIDELSKNMMFL